MAILALTELIDRRAGNADVTRQVDSIRRCIQRGKAVTDEILSGRGLRTAHMGVIDVRGWMREAVDDLASVLPPNIRLELRVPDDDLFLVGDEQRLGQVLTNLVFNARDAMPQGGTLVISCEACASWQKLRFSVSSPDRYLHLKVRDTGTGIPQATLHRIFDARFTTKPDGNGIGLSLAREVVQQHDGQIFAESTLGEGTVLHVFLPLASKPTSECAASAPQPRVERTTSRTGLPAPESQVVLLVDDDLMVTEALAVGLEREGRTIISCNDFESAQIMVERWTPSHIVTDVHLSGPFKFEGLDLIRYASQHSPLSRLILMTGEAPDSLQMEASERGAVAFLQKPFELSELDTILDLVSSAPSTVTGGSAGIFVMPSFDAIVSSDSLAPLFQPIVRLDSDHRPVGYEALARYRSNPLLQDPRVLFDYAARKGRIADLELACMSRSLVAARQLPAEAVLFINIHPAVLRSEEVRSLIAREGTSFGTDRIVLELTEQASLPQDPAIFEDIDRLRAIGIRFAFDDVGVAYSHLTFIDRVKPSFLKIGQDFGKGFERNAGRTNMIVTLLGVAKDFGCAVILEGIENGSTAAAARELGVQYGQGFFFAQPAEISEFAGRSSDPYCC